MFSLFSKLDCFFNCILKRSSVASCEAVLTYLLTLVIKEYCRDSGYIMSFFNIRIIWIITIYFSYNPPFRFIELLVNELPKLSARSTPISVEINNHWFLILKNFCLEIGIARDNLQRWFLSLLVHVHSNRILDFDILALLLVEFESFFDFFLLFPVKFLLLMENLLILDDILDSLIFIRSILFSFNQRNAISQMLYKRQENA